MKVKTSRYLTYPIIISGYPEKWRLDTIKASLTTYKWQCRSVNTGAALLHWLLYLRPMTSYVLCAA